MGRHSNTWGAVLGLAGLLAGMAAVVPPAAASTHCGTAPTFMVNEFIDDDGTATPAQCSIREAVAEANAAVGSATVLLGSGTYVLSLPAGGLGITGDVTIVGAGADKTVIDAGAVGAHLTVSLGASLDLSGVTLTNGSEGALVVQGTAVVTDSLIDGNSTASSGGGISVGGGGASLEVHGSTISNNTAADDSGAINHSSAAHLLISNSSITGNSSSFNGGAMTTRGTTDIVVENSTIVGNDAGTDTGGIVPINSSAVTIRNSILAANTSGSGARDCNLGVVSEGHNVLGDCSTVVLQPGDQVVGVVAPGALVQPLGYYGGTTPTRPPVPGSAAIDGGSQLVPGSGTPACLSLDQRGVTRPDGTYCDVGAVEGALTRPAITPFGVLADPEGDVGTSVWQLPVFLSAPAPGPVSIDWVVGDVPANPSVAHPGTDIVAASGTVTFAPGETTQFVDIEVIGDLLDEPPLLWGEWGLVVFSNPSPNAVLDTATFFGAGLVVIVDDD